MDIAIVLIIVAVAVVLFATEKLSMDVVAILVLGSLTIFGLVGPAEALSGFGHPATVTVGAMFVLSAGLNATGALGTLGQRLIRHGKNETMLLLLVMVGAAIVSPFINNTAAVAVFLPLVIGAAAMLALDLEVTYLGKHTLFRWPLAPIMRALGGVPIDRDSPGSGVVEEFASALREADSLVIALSPEGTRGPVERWRTGFHHIATAAGVPIVPVALDYGPRVIRIGAPFAPGDDIEGDLAELESFFAGARGYRSDSRSR